jgi:hypothetical protein
MDFESFSLDSSERARLSAEASSDCAKMFYAHEGRLIHKWLHYLDVYDRHFSVYRNKPVKMLEIGVSEGGSLVAKIFRPRRGDFWNRHNTGMREPRDSTQPGQNRLPG